ncbi:MULTISPECIES: hypothetical protein [Edwardsiella]|uniref:Uncharacterized protein n=2 Tax=Edwardsiella anguillarum TaxID=1821960 RepID=A0A076LR17_9GAMM|nr:MULTISPECIES: hypothetical protein [Edwardsiella]AIJ09112.1 Hypothetical protein ETEE_2679 [Edwardsiella anguillarum ET080813]MDA6076137.1 hypothetical protein [Edwardsiella anguillarum]UBU94875.1 hypothetical protein AAZ33_18690 [Edwardsiella sp. LADL05-105]UOU80276.1 hypothetical protein MUN71_06670 [Edwardsiella anguillarum]WHP84703.1 hypothetical protein MQ095_04420 [Edwardsiella anguillarum]
MNDHDFNFYWLDQGIVAIRKRVSAGTVLGIGIWIKAKIAESESKNKK